MYDESRAIRDMIDGELNRIILTDDKEEIIKMMGYLMLNINRYAEIAKARIRADKLNELNADRGLDL